MPFWCGWALLCFSMNLYMWPFHWDPPPFRITSFAFDLFMAFFLTDYLSRFYRRAKEYREVRHTWSQGIRGPELKVIQRTVASFKAKAAEAACPRCDENRKQDCRRCKGTGYKKGKGPFRIPFKGNHDYFLGFNTLTGEPEYLQGEAIFSGTNVFGIQGSGKTKRFALNILKQVFTHQKTSMIYFSLKDQDARTVREMGAAYGWKVTIMRGISLRQAFSRWSLAADGLRKGIFAAGYSSRETFWLDTVLDLIAEHLRQSADPTRLGPALEEILKKIEMDLEGNPTAKTKLMALADLKAYFLDFDQPLSPVRWLFDASPNDFLPWDVPGEKPRRAPCWDSLAEERNVIIIPPVEKSKAGIVAATALKYSFYLWFDQNKAKFLQPRVEDRHAIFLVQDEGDQFLIKSDSPSDLSDNYANTKFREYGLVSFVLCQTKQQIIQALTPGKAESYLATVGNVFTFNLPDEALNVFLNGLPKYETWVRTSSLNRSGGRFDDLIKGFDGEIRVQQGEALQSRMEPWIDAHAFQSLPKGCGIFQQTGIIPKVLYFPFYTLTDFEGAGG